MIRRDGLSHPGVVIDRLTVLDAVEPESSDGKFRHGNRTLRLVRHGHSLRNRDQILVRKVAQVESPRPTRGVNQHGVSWRTIVLATNRRGERVLTLQRRDAEFPKRLAKSIEQLVVGHALILPLN
jgi:hypothetical protein